MQRSNLQVMVRPRRLPGGGQRSSIQLDKYGNEIEMTNNMFQYDVVFDEDATQEEVYERLRPAVEKLVEGYCVGILAYGQTSSGKTYTIGTNGVEECYVKNPGIISRAASDIFRLAVPRHETTQINVRVSFMEIYNEQAFDLLHVDDRKKPLIKRVRDVARKDRPGELVTDVEGLAFEEVRSCQEVMDVLQRGSRNRRVASTSMNANSSRSHAVFTIFVEHLNEAGESTLASTPYLQLVDLAGSEVPEGDKATMKEGVNINKSLSALGRVILQLRDRSVHVSYRDSVLTRVLKPLLDGNSITTLIACISMEACNEAESKKTLHYAQQARKIEITAQKAQKAITQEEFLKLKEENRRLKKLCAQHQLELGDLEVTLIELEEEKVKKPGDVGRTEEMIQILLKYEAASKRNDALQERCNQLEELVDTFSKRFEQPEFRTRTVSGAETPLPSDAAETSMESAGAVEDNADNEQPRDELALVSALSLLDRDYDENANQLKYFVEMQKKSKLLQEKVLELEQQLESSENEKAKTAGLLSNKKTPSCDLEKLQCKLAEQTEKNRALQEKLNQLKKELKSSSVQNETIEKYKAKVEAINCERVKLQKLLKEQTKKSQEEIKRQKREMILLQRQQRKADAERRKVDARQAAERRCQQRKLEQALAAKDRLEMLLKKKAEAKQQSNGNNKSRLDSSSSGGTSVHCKVKEMVDDEVNMAATRALTTFYIDEYTKQIQALSSRTNEIEAQLNEAAADLDDKARSELEAERADLADKRKDAQRVLDNNQEVQKSAESSVKLHERFTAVPYEAQLAIKFLVSKCETLAYQAAAYRDELSTVMEQHQNTQQLLANCEHDKHLVEEKYAAFLLEAGSTWDEANIEKLEQELSEKNAIIDQLNTKLNSMSRKMMIPRSPFVSTALQQPRRATFANRTVDKLRWDADHDTSSTLFSKDERSLKDNPLVADPDWVAGRTSAEGHRRSNRSHSGINSNSSHNNNSNSSNNNNNNNSSCSSNSVFAGEAAFDDSGPHTPPFLRGRKTIKRRSYDEHAQADVENIEPPRPKKMSEGGATPPRVTCGCSGGKSCQTCQCARVGLTCTPQCKCSTNCYNAPVLSDEDLCQPIPASIAQMAWPAEDHTLY